MVPFRFEAADDDLRIESCSSDFHVLYEFRRASIVQANELLDYFGYLCLIVKVIEHLTRGDSETGGTPDIDLLIQLNNLEYYKQPPPKSLSNEFGTDEVFPLIQSFDLPVKDKLRTYIEHITEQLSGAFYDMDIRDSKVLVSGGGAFNTFLMTRLKSMLKEINVEVVIPDKNVVQYKEALVMALLGLLRWREENTVMSSVTGAVRNSIGGAVWMGLEA